MRALLSPRACLAIVLAACFTQACGGSGDTSSSPAASSPDSGAQDSDMPDSPEPQDAVVSDQAAPDAAPDTPLEAQAEDAAEQDAGGDAPQDGAGDADSAIPGAGCLTGQYQPYFGDLHAHTSYSDGEKEPADAFAYARDVAGLDIMVVTDHLEQLYWVPPVNRWGECQSQADGADQPGVFLADCGFEYGSGFILPTFQSTGHNNVFFAPSLFPAVQTDFHDFYGSLAGCDSCIGQFNHPGDEPTQTWNDFEYQASVDDKVNLFEFNGGGDVWALFLEALDVGWHVSPMFNQDNHSANWGTANDNRSGLYMSELSRPALYEAMKARRTFATEDKNASIRMMADDICWMGSMLQGYPAITLSVFAQDADAGDGFESIELYGPGGAALGTFACNGNPSCEASFPQTISGPVWYVARAVQNDGNVLVSAPIWAQP